MAPASYLGALSHDAHKLCVRMFFYYPVRGV